MNKIDINELKSKAIHITEPDLDYIDGKYIQFFRSKHCWSQALLASYLGVSTKVVVKWERGKKKINETAQKLIFLMNEMPETINMLRCVKYPDFEEELKRL